MRSVQSDSGVKPATFCIAYTLPSPEAEVAGTWS